MSTKKSAVKPSEQFSQTVGSLRNEEDWLKKELSYLAALGKIIDNGTPRSSIHYEDALRRRLQQVRDAMLSLTLENFGKCLGCGVKLDPKHMETDPALTRCHQCQSTVDKQHDK